MKIDRTGCTRIVLLTKRYAIKIPNFIDGYKSLLNGLLANLEEREFSKLNYKQLCPILFSLPLGLINVMPKVKILSDEEFTISLLDEFDIFSVEDSEYKLDIVCNGYFIRVENKANSFGWLNEKLVCVDYGN